MLGEGCCQRLDLSFRFSHVALRLMNEAVARCMAAANAQGMVVILYIHSDTFVLFE